MLFDIVTILLFFYFSYRGYEKGLVSSLLSVLVFVFSIIISKYICRLFPILKIGVFSNAIQIFVTTILILIFGKILIRKINFESIFILGGVSRILGLITYSIFFIVITSFICEIIYFIKNIGLFESDFLKDSFILNIYKEVLPLNILYNILNYFIR